MQFQIISDTSHDLSDLAELYIACFGSGRSAQLIEKEQAEDYFRKTISIGGSCNKLIENEKTIAAILIAPPAYDQYLPEEIRYLSHQNCIYIAELMVTENYRGQGIGQKLLSETLKKYIGYGVLIRVWKENSPALHLYRKLGFKEVASIRQTKTKPDGKTFFEMEKVYLHKNN